MGDLSRNFSRKEFECRCGDCGFDSVDAELVDVLQDVRDRFKEPLTINSGCRCPEHNKNIGGSEKSKHIRGLAADIFVQGVYAEAVAQYLETKYPDKYGLGRYYTFTHIDVRKYKARWDKRQ